MVKKVVLEGSEIGRLGCMNLNGLNAGKLRKARQEQNLKEIDLVGHGEERIILDGTHTAWVAQERGLGVEARVWEVDERPPNPVADLNLRTRRYAQLHETASLLRRGRIRDLKNPLDD
ncbi:hypothetical protein ACFL2C_03025 [Patescibacteria group bacterium]